MRGLLEIVEVRERRLIILAIALGLAGFAGCGGRTAYQVKGRVQHQDGTPITGAVRVIRLEPAAGSEGENRKAASGMIETDGSFEVFTRKPGDGVRPGKYAVTFTVMDKVMGGKLLIPTKYTTMWETPFELVVDDDKTELLFELEKM